MHGVAAKCYDVLRYTCILECSKYVTGTTAILEHLNGALQPLKNKTKTKRNETKRNATQRNKSIVFKIKTHKHLPGQAKERNADDCDTHYTC